MTIQKTDTFNEKCDKVLVYLKQIKDNDPIVITSLPKFISDINIDINDPVIGFLIYEKKFIGMEGNPVHIFIRPAGIAFISHSSFVELQKK